MKALETSPSDRKSWSKPAAKCGKMCLSATTTYLCMTPMEWQYATADMICAPYDCKER